MIPILLSAACNGFCLTRKVSNRWYVQ